MDDCYECYVLSGAGLCDELITRLEESYRLWWAVACDLDISGMRWPWPTAGLSRHKKERIEKYLIFALHPIYVANLPKCCSQTQIMLVMSKRCLPHKVVYWCWLLTLVVIKGVKVRNTALSKHKESLSKIFLIVQKMKGPKPIRAFHTLFRHGYSVLKNIKSIWELWNVYE
jgi:hypothetical protein